MFCCHSVPEPCNRGASLLSGRPTQGTVRPPSPKRSPGCGEMQVEKAMQGQGSAVPPPSPAGKGSPPHPWQCLVGAEAGTFPSAPAPIPAVLGVLQGTSSPRWVQVGAVSPVRCRHPHAPAQQHSRE